MVVSDPFSFAVQEMQQGGHADRVKKLVYFTCTSTWESDVNKLNQVDLKSLLEQLCREHTTLESLGQRFREAISHINKKAEYARIAKMLLSKLQPFYQEQSPHDSGTPAPAAVDPPIWVAPQPALPLGYGGMQLQKQDYDPFELRAGVMRQTSPLRAKLVAFTALHHKLEPSLQGLAALRRYNFDDLLKELYDACNSPEELETRLKQAVQQLEEPEQDSQAANALLQMMKPLYVYLSLEPSDSGGLASETASGDLDWLNGETAGTSRITLAEPWASDYLDGGEPLDPNHPYLSADAWPEVSFAPPPADPVTLTPPPSSASRSRFVTPPPIHLHQLPERSRQLLDRSASSLMATIENTLSELGNALDERLQDEDPAQYLTLKHQVLRGLLRDVEGSAVTFMAILKKLEQSERRLVQPDLPEVVTEVPSDFEDPYSALRQVLATSELTQQKPQLEQEVMRLVRRNISSIKIGIENALSELGNALDEQFQTHNLEEALFLKYQALRTFLHEIEEISSKFATLLDRMEEAERRLFGLT
ncbi:MAG: hypothetical protein Q6L68_04555 [Thermostichus sp. DG02_5_bins_236]